MEQSKQFIDIAEQLLGLAKKAGASQAAVVIAMEDGFSINVRQQRVETLEHHHDTSVAMNVYFGQQKGSVSFSNLRQPSLEAAVKKACEIAKYTQPDPFHGLPDKALLPQEAIDLDLFHPWSITTDEAIEKAIVLEKQALSLDKKIAQAENVDLHTHNALTLHANSLGFVGVVPSTRHSVSCSLIAERDGEMERDYAYTLSRYPEKLLADKALAEKAVEKTVSRLGARKIKTCRMPVIFSAQVARGILAILLSAISGSSIYKKSSFLLDRLGEKIMPDFIQISENPYLAGAISSAYFDGDGVATSQKTIIESGVLNTYLLDCYSARQLKMQSTGNSGGVYNVFIDTENYDLSGLLKKMGTGLLVTELMGQGVNVVTGDYSRGASGFWVENGEIQYPVNEVTIAGNLKDMLANIVAVANDIDPNGNIKTGSILIEEMTIAGE